MTLNSQTQENKSYSAQPSLFKSPWKWEKRHWLLVIAGGCLVLFWFGSNMLEVSLVKKTIELLPVIGGFCFAADSIVKLIQ